MKAAEQILTAADVLFGERGFEATSTREIAERSGVNKALIYYHYKNKEHLFEQVLDRYYGRLSETLIGSIEREGSVRVRMANLLDAYVDFLAANRRTRQQQRPEERGRDRNRQDPEEPEVRNLSFDSHDHPASVFAVREIIPIYNIDQAE